MIAGNVSNSVHNGLDWNRVFALKQAGGSEEFLANLLEIYRKTLHKEMAHIRSAMAAKDFVKMAAVAHTIKGASMSLGMEGICVIAYHLEIASKNCIFDDAVRFMAALEELYVRILRIFAEEQRGSM